MAEYADMTSLMESCFKVVTNLEKEQKHRFEGC